MLLLAAGVELTYLLFATVLTLVYLLPSSKSTLASLAVAVLLATKLWLQCFAGFVVSFSGLTYLHSVIPFVLGIVGLCIAIKNRQALFGAKTYFDLPKGMMDRGVLCVLVGVFLGAALISLRLIDETDSHHHMNYVTDWLRGTASAVPFAYTNYSPIEWVKHYVYFWEVGHIPLLSVAPNDSLLWANQLEALILFLSVLLYLYRQFSVGFVSALMLLLYTATLYSFWSSTTTGLGTIKNDIPMHAGLLLFISGLMLYARGEANRLTYALIFLGGAFASVKFSGCVILGGVFFCALITLGWKKVCPITPSNPLLLLAGGFFAGPALSYVRNLWENGNPLYPIKMSLFGNPLPGIFDLTHSSILSHWNERAVWVFLVGGNRGYIAGFLCWASVFLSLLILVRSLVALIRTQNLSEERQRTEGLLAFISGASLCLFVLYISSFWSAGQPGTDLTYIETQNSYRYALSWFALSGLVGYLAVRTTVPHLLWVYFILLAVDIKFRLTGIMRMEWSYHLGGDKWATTSINLALLLGVFSACYYLYVKKPALRVLAIAAFIPVLMFVGMSQVNLSRSDYMPWYPGLAPLFADMPAQDIASLSSLDDTLLGTRTQRDYPLTGRYFQHKVMRTNLAELTKAIEAGRAKPNFIVYMSAHHTPLEQREIDAVAKALPNYALIQNRSNHAVWVEITNVPTGNAHEGANKPRLVASDDQLGTGMIKACEGKAADTVYYLSGKLYQIGCGSVVPVNDKLSETALADVSQDATLAFDKKSILHIKGGEQFDHTVMDQADFHHGWSVWQDGAEQQASTAHELTYKSTRERAMIGVVFEPWQKRPSQTNLAQTIILKLSAKGCAPFMRGAVNDFVSKKFRTLRYVSSWRLLPDQKGQYFIFSHIYGKQQKLNNISFDLHLTGKGCEVTFSAEEISGLALPPLNVDQVDLSTAALNSQSQVKGRP